MGELPFFYAVPLTAVKDLDKHLAGFALQHILRERRAFNRSFLCKAGGEQVQKNGKDNVIKRLMHRRKHIEENGTLQQLQEKGSITDLWAANDWVSGFDDELSMGEEGDVQQRRKDKCKACGLHFWREGTVLLGGRVEFHIFGDSVVNQPDAVHHWCFVARFLPLYLCRREAYLALPTCDTDNTDWHVEGWVDPKDSGLKSENCSHRSCYVASAWASVVNGTQEQPEAMPSGVACLMFPRGELEAISLIIRTALPTYNVTGAKEAIGRCRFMMTMAHDEKGPLFLIQQPQFAGAPLEWDHDLTPPKSVAIRLFLEEDARRCIVCRDCSKGPRMACPVEGCGDNVVHMHCIDGLKQGVAFLSPPLYFCSKNHFWQVHSQHAALLRSELIPALEANWVFGDADIIRKLRSPVAEGGYELGEASKVNPDESWYAYVMITPMLYNPDGLIRIIASDVRLVSHLQVLYEDFKKKEEADLVEDKTDDLKLVTMGGPQAKLPNGDRLDTYWVRPSVASPALFWNWATEFPLYKNRQVLAVASVDEKLTINGQKVTTEDIPLDGRVHRVLAAERRTELKGIEVAQRQTEMSIEDSDVAQRQTEMSIEDREDAEQQTDMSIDNREAAQQQTYMTLHCDTSLPPARMVSLGNYYKTNFHLKVIYPGFEKRLNLDAAARFFLAAWDLIVSRNSILNKGKPSPDTIAGQVDLERSCRARMMLEIRNHEVVRIMWSWDLKFIFDTYHEHRTRYTLMAYLSLQASRLQVVWRKYIGHVMLPLLLIAGKKAIKKAEEGTPEEGLTTAAKRKIRCEFELMKKQVGHIEKLLSDDSAHKGRDVLLLQGYPGYVEFRTRIRTPEQWNSVVRPYIYERCAGARGNIGNALFAKQNIAKGMPIIDYVGHVCDIMSCEIVDRFRASVPESCYLFALSQHLSSDAKFGGGPARFANHSCAPNMIPMTIRVLDVREPDHLWKQEEYGLGELREVITGKSYIYFIAEEEITAESELTFDYCFDFEYWSGEPCFCGSTNCVRVYG